MIFFSRFKLSDIKREAKVAVINQIAYMPPPVPGLVQDDSNVAYCDADNLPEKYAIGANNSIVYHCPHFISLKLDNVYDFLLIHNSSTEPVSHPIHMHGYLFQIIDMGTVDQLVSGKTPFAKAKHPPMLKDTVAIPRYGFVRIRLRTTNPGFWMFHCHIEDHMTPGMMLVLKMGNKRDMPQPPPNFPKCGDYLGTVFE